MEMAQSEDKFVPLIDGGTEGGLSESILSSIPDAMRDSSIYGFRMGITRMDEVAYWDDLRCMKLIEQDLEGKQESSYPGFHHVTSVRSVLC